MILQGKAAQMAEEFENLTELLQKTSPEPLKRELTEDEQTDLFVITAMFEIDLKFSMIMRGILYLYKDVVLTNKTDVLIDELIELAKRLKT
jgi:hypothetical protein